MRAEFGLIVVICAEGRRADAYLLGKKAREVGIILEAELTCYFLNRFLGIGQFALHPQDDFTPDEAAGGKSDGGSQYLVQIASRDVQTVGIERGLAVLGDMAVE